MSEFPLWFNPEEYADFITESKLLFEFNIPLQKQKTENRKKIMQFDRQTALRRNSLKMELLRDAGQAKAKGIQMGLGEHFKQNMMDAFFAKLLEAANPVKSEKRKMRPEVDPADRERDRKRESRRQEKQSGLKNILIVKNKSLNRVEIIQKSDFDAKNHELIKGTTKNMDKGSVSVEDLKRYSQRSDFRNTKTSIRILGKIQKVVEKEQADQQQDESQGGSGQAPMQAEAPPPPPRPRVPSDGKEITDVNSTYADWDHNTAQLIAGIPEILNTLSGTEMSEEMQQALSDSRTLGDALNRFTKELLITFPDAANYTFSLADKPVSTGKMWGALGMKKSMPKANLYAENGKTKIGISTKIGTQLRPADKGEAGAIYSSVLSAVDPASLSSIFGLLLKSLVAELRTSFAKAPTPPNFTQKDPAFAEIEKQTWEMETTNNREKLFINKCRNTIEVLLNKHKALKTAFIGEALTGNIKFEGKEGIANALIYLNKDGSNTEFIPLDQNYFDALSKSTDTNLVLKFGPANIQEGSPAYQIVQEMGQLNESANTGLKSFEDMIGQMSDPNVFMQLFGIQIQDAVFKEPVCYSDFYFENSDRSNVITFDPGTSTEHEITIPVHTNFTPAGEQQDVLEKGADALLESYLLTNDFLVEQVKANKLDLLDALIIIEQEFNLLEKRNYRKEYDNYHSKPEQRANRSKRVLARRKMEKKGRVRKGDGKDVDHKNGNPQDNSDGNLRVLSKSKNRSMNEDHGAGFEGTPELLDKFVKETPFAVNPTPPSKSLPYPENKYVNKTKKK